MPKTFYLLTMYSCSPTTRIIRSAIYLHIKQVCVNRINFLMCLREIHGEIFLSELTFLIIYELENMEKTSSSFCNLDVLRRMGEKNMLVSMTLAAIQFQYRQRSIASQPRDFLLLLWSYLHLQASRSRFLSVQRKIEAASLKTFQCYCWLTLVHYHSTNKHELQ